MKLNIVILKGYNTDTEGAKAASRRDWRVIGGALFRL